MESEELKSCGYCRLVIQADDPAYVHKWFPNHKKLMPVHEYHLRIHGKPPVQPVAKQPEKDEGWWERHQQEEEKLMIERIDDATYAANDPTDWSKEPSERDIEQA